MCYLDCFCKICCYLFYFIDVDNFDVLLKEYDSNIARKVTPDNLLAILDATSLLWRLHVSKETATNADTVNYPDI